MTQSSHLALIIPYKAPWRETSKNAFLHRGAFVGWFIECFPANTCGQQDSANAPSKNELQGDLQDKVVHKYMVNVFSVYLKPQGIKLFRNKSIRICLGVGGERTFWSFQMALHICGVEITVQCVGILDWTIFQLMGSSVQLLLKFIKWNRVVLMPVIVVQNAL